MQRNVQYRPSTRYPTTDRLLPVLAQHLVARALAPAAAAVAASLSASAIGNGTTLFDIIFSHLV